MTKSDRPDEATLNRLSFTDAVFIYGETASMPMHTMGTVLIDPSGVPGGFGFDQIAETVAARIHLIPPFRQRLLQVPFAIGHPVLVDDPDFRLENHLHRLAVPAPGRMQELAQLVGDLAGRPLDRHQPLWEMWAVEGLAGGRIALVTKLHHSIIDGASGASQMAGLMDLEPDATVEAPEPWNPPPLPSTLSLTMRSVGTRFVGPVRFGRLLFDTARGMGQRRRAVREIADPERSSLLEIPPKTPLNRAVTPRRSVAYGTVSLADVKRVKKAFGVTVNDVVLAASALALRRYLTARGGLPDEPLVCAVPVSLKSESEKKNLSNKVSAFAIRLPTHLEDAGEVVEAVRREMANAKHVHQAVTEDVLPDWLGLLPPTLTQLGIQLFSELDVADRVPPLWNVVVSNMMGPPVPLYFGGARVEAVYPMGPVAEGIGLNITLLSNMGRLDVGVLTCREVVPDPEAVTEAFSQALEDLELAAEGRESPAPQAALS